jgi:hypothetical protein
MGLHGLLQGYLYFFILLNMKKCVKEIDQGQKTSPPQFKRCSRVSCRRYAGDLFLFYLTKSVAEVT